jgi:thymidylate synthase (FAD)
MKEKIYLYDDQIGSVEYVQHMGDDLTIVNAARVSFGKQKDEIDGKDKRLIKYLIRHRHTSTLEHNVVTFRFCVPLFVRSQHHRHRTWSYNEISRRYTDENLQFYEPKLFRTQHESNRQASNEENMINPLMKIYDPACSKPMSILSSKLVENFHKDALKYYDSLLAAGVCREQARGLLPQNLYTEYYGTVNLNNLIKFISLRTHDGAQQEIRVVANACRKIATDLWPIAMKNLKIKE